jgi:hypothetical protein
MIVFAHIYGGRYSVLFGYCLDVSDLSLAKVSAKFPIMDSQENYSPTK